MNHPFTIGDLRAWLADRPELSDLTPILFEAPESFGGYVGVDPPFVDFCAHDAQFVYVNLNAPQSLPVYQRCDCFQPAEELGPGVAFEAVCFGPSVMKIDPARSYTPDLFEAK